MHGAIPPLLEYVYMVWYLVRHRDNFTFYLPVHQGAMAGDQPTQSERYLNTDNPKSHVYLHATKTLWP
jgi:hypothetical protein